MTTRIGGINGSIQGCRSLGPGSFPGDDFVSKNEIQLELKFKIIQDYGTKSCLNNVNAYSGGGGFSSTVGELSACEILRKDPQVNVETRFSREK